jgi:hypothetical protein
MKRTWTASMALVLAVLFSGTLAPHASAMTASNQPTGAASTKTAKIRALDLALDYPAAWTVFTVDPKVDARTRDALLKANPQLAKAFDEAAAESVAKGYKFSAQDFDAKIRGEFASTVGVSETLGVVRSLHVFDASIRSQLEPAGGTVIRTSAVRISGDKAWRADLRITVNVPNSVPISVRVSVLAVPRGVGSALVAVGAADDDAGNALIDSILATVRRI